MIDTEAARPSGLERAERWTGRARRLPSWMGSIRFRMALIYSCVLFGLGAIALGVVYLGIAHALDDEPISRRVTQLVPLPGGGVLVDQSEQVDPYLYIEREANARAVETLRQYSFVALLGLFWTSLGVGWVVAGQVLRPIDRITSVARDIQATDLSRRIGLGGPEDELRDLADTFDAMLDRLDDAFEGQRQFIHEASHELRNPLAVIRTNLEVVLADPDASVDDLRHTAEVVQRSSERMSRLVDDLLVYARQGSLSYEREPVDLADLAAEGVDDFAAAAAEHQVRLRLRAEPAPAVADRQALRQALANLLANALRYAPPGSTVTCASGADTEGAWLTVSDEGPGVPEADRERVFQRFWRRGADPASAARSGLGLTIVRQVAEASGGTVQVDGAPVGGARFTLRLPVRS